MTTETEERVSLSAAKDREETMDKPGILMAVRDAGRAKAYVAVLESLAECTVLGSLREIPGMLRQRPFRGILIDIHLMVKANYMDRVRISDALDAMPSATLNLDNRTGSVRLLMLNQTHGTARTPEDFIRLCSAFQPQVIYPHDQDSLHLNAVLSTTPGFDAEPEHTFTMKVSGGGCFLFTASRDRYQPEDTVWIDFVGLANRHPIQATVCWKCDWGVAHMVPGIHVRFESMLEAQFEEIAALLANRGT